MSRLARGLLGLVIAVVSLRGEYESEVWWTDVVTEDFSTDLDQWIIEQTPKGRTRIIDGQLDIDGGGTTVWLKQRLTGPTIIEFDARMVVAGGPNDNCRDLNSFWMASDPREPERMFDGAIANSASRGGVFANYSGMRTYYVGCGGNRNTTTRFRRYPGGGERPLLPEHDLGDSRFLLEPNHTYRVKIVADGERIQWWRDGECFFDFVDEDPLTSGWFGFRTVSNHLRIDNVRVRQPRGAAFAAVEFERRVFKRTPQRELHLRILRPEGPSPAGGWPAIVLFHGGGWRRGEPEQFDDQARHLAARGMITIQPAYRLIERDGTTPFESAADARSAMRWVQQHAAELGIDPTRIHAGGGSAGGHLAASLLLDGDLDDPADDLGVPIRPASLVLFNPVFDNGPHGYGYERFGRRFMEISPLHAIAPGWPPTLILVGDQDVNLPVDTCELYRELMRKAGNVCELEIYPGFGHGFFNLRKGGKDVHRSATARMDAFLTDQGGLSRLSVVAGGR